MTIPLFFLMTGGWALLLAYLCCRRVSFSRCVLVATAWFAVCLIAAARAGLV